MEPRTLLAFALVIGTTLAGPISWDDSRCARQCHSSSSKFKYEEGKTYVYKFDSTNILEVPELATPSALSLKCTLEISALGNCEMLLKIKDVRVDDGSTYHGHTSSPLVEGLTATPLPFSFEDGKIDIICPSPDEDPEATNIKRAMLSALQNSMRSFTDHQDYITEIDVLGTCKTSYRLEERGYDKITVKKSKDLKSCTSRHGGNIAIFNHIYNNGDTTSSLPVLTDETNECEQVIENGIITSVVCAEKSLMKLFVKEGLKIAAKGDISIRFDRVKRNGRQPSYTVRDRSDLLYYHVPEKYSDSSIVDAENILRQMCAMSQETVDPQMPVLFYQLVHVLRKVEPRSLQNIYAKLESGSPCSSPWILGIAKDALPHVGNEGAIKVMVNEIMSGKSSKVQTVIWLTSLAFVQEPTEEAIIATVPLLQSDKGGRQALLGISAMCHKLCMKKSSCEQTSAIQQVITALSKYLGYKCRASGIEEENQVISALKAFGNLGRVGDATNKILDCALHSSNKIPMRLAAIEAFRKVPVKHEVKDKMYELYSHAEEPVEIRIAAYLAAMKYADEDLISKIVKVLNEDKSSQVKAFVWTHLINLQKSSSPLKQHIRDLVLKVHLPFDVPHNIMKYSQNIDWSTFSHQLNLGGEFDSNVIYSGESFLPRSLMTNLTTFLFGHNLNLLEVGARAEGFEYFAERIFGPQGYAASEPSFKEILEKIFGDLVKGIGKRPDTGDWDWDHKYKKKIDLFTERANIKTPSDPQGSVYFKHQGDELLWISFDKDTDLNLGKAFDLMDMLSSLARHNKINTAHSMIFLDTTLVCPSVTGRGIQLTLNGTLTMGIKAEGKMDVRKALSKPTNVDIDGEFRPSMAAEINAVMKIKSGMPGVKFSSKVSAAVPLKGKILIQNGRLLHVKLHMPDEKINLYKSSVDMVKVDERGREISITKQPAKSISSCVTLFRKSLGFDVCTDIDLPQPVVSKKPPYIPFSGPFSLQASVIKSDRSLRFYELIIELPEHKVYQSKMYKFKFDTPGTSINRKHLLALGFNQPSDMEGSINVELEMPSKKLEGSASVVNKGEQKHIKADWMVDRRDHYSVDAELTIRKRGSVTDYNPKLVLKFLNHEPVTLSGAMKWKSGKKSQLTVDLSSNKPSKKPFSVKGNVFKEGYFTLTEMGQWKLSTDVVFNLPTVDSRIHGTVYKQDKIFITDMIFDYQKEGRRHHSLKLTSKIQDLSSRTLTKLSAMAGMQGSQYPESNFELDWDFQYQPKEHIENDITVKTGERLKTSLHFLQVTKIFSHYQSGKQLRSDNRLVIFVPDLKVNYDVKFDTDWDFVDFSKCKFETELKSDQEKYVWSLFDYRMESRRPLKTGVIFKIVYPGRDIVYEDQVSEESPNEYQGKSSFQWQRDKKASMDYTYRVKSDSDSFHHELDASIDGPWLRTPMHQKALLKLGKKSIDIRSHTLHNGRPTYKFDAKLSTDKGSEISVISPEGDGTVKLNIDDPRNIITFDIKRNRGSRNRILGYAFLTVTPKKAFEMNVKWDADRDPSRSLSISTELETESHSWRHNKYHFIGKFQATKYAGMVDAKISDKILVGPHVIELSGVNDVSHSIKLQHEIKEGRVNSEILYTKQQQEVLKAVARGKYHRDSSRIEVMSSVALTSSHRKWDGKEIYIKYNQDLNSPLTFVAQGRVQQSPDRQYVLNVDCAKIKSWSSSTLKAHASLTTPIPNYRSQEININGESTSDVSTFTADAVNDRGRQLYITGTMEKSEHGIKVMSEFELPSVTSLSTGKINLMYHIESRKYMLQCKIEANRERILDASANIVATDLQNFDISASMGSIITPMVRGHVSAKKNDYGGKYDLTLSKDSQQITVWKLSTESSSRSYVGNVEVFVKGEKLLHMSVRCESQGRQGEKCSIDATGSRFTPRNVVLSYRRQENLIQSSISICKQSYSTECTAVEGHYKKEDGSYYGTFLREIKVLVRRPRESDVSFECVFGKEKWNVNSRIIAAWKDKKVGYDVLVHYEQPRREARVQIFLPQREMKIGGTVVGEDQELFIKLELLPNVKLEPSNRLALEISHKDNQHRRDRQIHTDVTLNHPDLLKPLMVNFDLRFKQDKYSNPLDVKLEIDYSNKPGTKLISTVHLESSGTDAGNHTIALALQKEDRRELDMLFKMHFANEQRVVSSGWEWQISTERMDRKSGFLLMELSRSDKTYGLWYNHPGLRFQGKGSWSVSNEDVLFSDFVYRADDNQDQKLEITVDYKRPCGDLSYFEDAGGLPSFKYHFCANTGGRSLVTISAESFYDNEKVSDFSFAFNSRTNHIFTLNLDWSPDFLGKLLHHASLLPEHIKKSLWIKVPQELLRLWEDIVSDFKHDLFMPLSKYLKREWNKLRNEVRRDADKLERIIEELYDKLPTTREIRKMLQPLIDGMKELVEKIEVWLDKTIPDFVWDSIRSIEDWFMKHFCKYGSLCYDIKQSIRRHGFFSTIVRKLSELLEDMVQATSKLSIRIGDLKMVSFREMYKYVVEFMEDVWYNTRLQINRWLDPIMHQKFVRNIVRSFQDMMDWVEDMYKEYKYSIQRRIDDFIDAIESNKDVRAVMDALEDIKETIADEFSKLKLKDVLQKLKSALSASLSKLKVQGTTSVLIFDPNKGRIRVEIHSPIDIPRLKQTLTDWATYKRPDEYHHSFSVLDTYHRIHALPQQEWIPPFKGEGMIINGQHFLTFDKTMYDFKGECSYLLLHDLVDGNFSLIVNYEADEQSGKFQKTITVVSKRNTIEIIPSEHPTVTVNGRPVELPHTIGSIRISIDGHSITVNDDKGLTLNCHLIYDVCTTTVSGWYFGKVGGLLGTYDNEPHNDFRLPGGDITTSPSEFVDSWEVSGNCRPSTSTTWRTSDPMVHLSKICKEMFKNDDSPLRPCYPEVDPNVYFMACLHVVRVESEKAACDVAAGYAMTCERHGYHVNMPPTCLGCKITGGSIMEYGTTQQLTVHRGTADFVFVIEENDCNHAMVSTLDTIARNIEREFLRKKFSNIQFGLVAYGGADQLSPHSHTARSKLLFGAQDIVLAAGTLQLHHHIRKNVDVFSAILFATHYPFRAGTSKFFILVPCSSCEERAMSISYPDMLHALKDQHIRLHLTRAEDLASFGQLKSKSVLGVDSDTVYTGKDVSQKMLEGHPELKDHVSLKKDICSALALQSSGSVFDTRWISEGSFSEAKNWKTVFARRLAKTTHSPCQHCECVMSKGFSSNARCRPCSRDTFQ